MYLLISIIFLLVVLAYETCNAVLIMRNRNWTPDTNDKEILFAHKYVGTKKSIRVWYIIGSFVKIFVAIIPTMFAAIGYQIRIVDFIVPNALVLIGCGAIIVVIEVIHSNYEIRIYQEGLRMAWLMRKEREDENGKER